MRKEKKKQPHTTQKAEQTNKQREVPEFWMCNWFECSCCSGRQIVPSPVNTKGFLESWPS